MKRFLLALFIALYLHGVLFLSKLPTPPDIPPRLIGEERIRISLHSTINKEPAITPQPKKKKKRIVVPRIIEPEIQKPQKPVEIAAEIPQKQNIPKYPPVLLKVRTEQKIRYNSPKSSTSKTTDTVLPSVNKKVVVSAAIISVKASPLYAKNPKPVYPALARRRNWQGTVTLSVLVSIEGKADTVKVHTSSGHALLDTSALKSVKSWRFLPGIESDRPVAMEVLVPIHFKLH